MSLLVLAVAQDNIGGNPVILKLKTTSAGWVNLALGRDQNATLGTNETLALVVDCAGDDLNLIVYDMH